MENIAKKAKNCQFQYQCTKTSRKITQGYHLFWYFSTHGTKRIFGFFCHTTTSLKVMMSRILVLTPPCQCAKFHEKILSTAREIQEISFFRAKIGYPGDFQKISYTHFNHNPIFFSSLSVSLGEIRLSGYVDSLAKTVE